MSIVDVLVDYISPDMSQQIQVFNSEMDLKKVLSVEYHKQIANYFGGDEKKTLRFLTSVVSAWQKNPKLKECTGISVINSFMTMASLGLMPSDISGEAYVIPYSNSRKEGDRWVKVSEAQFQIGYQGLVTLFYRAGARSIVAEIVYENDSFEIINNEIVHKPDVFSDDRGVAKGAYVIITLGNGGKVQKVMSKREILEIGENFSKSFSSDFSPWNERNDRQLWMWKKTVLKQCAKLVPKSDLVVRAVNEDNKDSVLSDHQDDLRQLPPPPMTPYQMERTNVVGEDEAGGSGEKVEQRHAEVHKDAPVVKEPKQNDPRSQKIEIAKLLKSKCGFVTIGKSQEQIAEKIMDVVGVSFLEENYPYITDELKEINTK